MVRHLPSTIDHLRFCSRRSKGCGFQHYLAYNKLLSGGVKSYRLDDRELTRLDLGKLSDEIKDAEEKVDELTALLNGQSARKAFAVIPRDW